MGDLTGVTRFETLVRDRLSRSLHIDRDELRIWIREWPERGDYVLGIDIEGFIRPDQPKDSVEYELDGWWARFKDRHKAALHGPTVLGALAPPRRRAINYHIYPIVRMCPHLATDNRSDHLQYVVEDTA